MEEEEGCQVPPTLGVPESQNHVVPSQGPLPSMQGLRWAIVNPLWASAQQREQ